MTKSARRYYLHTALLAVTPLLLLWLSRLVFCAYNHRLLGSPGLGHILELSCGGLRFDLAAWAYFNISFLLLSLLPFDFVLHRTYMRINRTLYCILNGLMLCTAYADIPFYPFSGTRLRLSALADMLSDSNIAGIILSYATDYWRAFLAVVILISVPIVLCVTFPREIKLYRSPHKWITASVRTSIFLTATALCFICMRGSVTAGKPLAISDAVWYTSTPAETNIVLNTPFCLIRSSRGSEAITPVTLMSEQELGSVRLSLHTPHWTADSFTRKNIVVITIESGSRHLLSNAHNPHTSESLMPFLDSLRQAGTECKSMYATGRRTIEGVTAIYGGIPTFGDMILMSSPYNAISIDAFPALLTKAGYSSKFYFGGNPGSYSIDALAHAMGFRSVADRTDYGNDADFDGHWGIFDHAMGEFAAQDMSTLKEPFVAGWLTLELHEPFSIPRNWDTSKFRFKNKSPERSAEYTDQAIRKFFESARVQPWYENTIFIITGDHGSRDFPRTEFDELPVQPNIMCIFFSPNSPLPRFDDSTRCHSQYDLSPTILDMVKYPNPYIAIGQSMVNQPDTEPTPNYAIGYFNGQYHITGPQYIITLSQNLEGIDMAYKRTDTKKPVNIASLSDTDKKTIDGMLRFAQAFLQDYTHRLTQGKLNQ